MATKVGHPALRLMRFAMEEFSIEGMKNGAVFEMKEKEFYSKLRIRN